MNKIWAVAALFVVSLIVVLSGVILSNNGVQADLGSYGAGLLALAAVLIGADAYRDGLKRDRLKFTEDALVKFDKYVEALLDIGSNMVFEGENSADPADIRMKRVQTNKEALLNFDSIISSAEIYLPDNILEHFYAVSSEFKEMNASFRSWLMFKNVDDGTTAYSKEIVEEFGKAFNLGGPRDNTVKDRLEGAQKVILAEKRRIHRLYYAE